MKTSSDHTQPLVAHLLELRRRLLWSLAMVGIVFIPLALMADELFEWLSGPLLAQMPVNTSLIATGVAAPFLAPFKLAVVTAIVISLPWILYQIWAFVAPGLYASERRLVVPLVLSSTSLFYAGMAFAYYVVFPVLFSFFVTTAPEGVKVMTDITNYVNFVLAMFLACGIIFETPVVNVLLVWTGATTPEKLASLRPYVLVAAFVVGMMLTPPNVISQALLAMPMYLLYEIGIFCARRLVPGSREVDAQRPGDKD